LNSALLFDRLATSPNNTATRQAAPESRRTPWLAQVIRNLSTPSELLDGFKRRSAATQLKVAEAQLKVAEAQLKVAEAQLKVAEAQHEQAKTDCR